MIQECYNTFVPSKCFGILLHISPKNLILLKMFNSELLYIEASFTDQNVSAKYWQKPFHQTKGKHQVV